MSNLFAYRFCLDREAWRLFCDEIGVCAEHVVDRAFGDWIVKLTDINMPTIAPPDEEMTELTQGVLGYEVEASDVATAEREMQDWQVLYRGLLGHTAPDFAPNAYIRISWGCPTSHIAFWRYVDGSGNWNTNDHSHAYGHSLFFGRLNRIARRRLGYF